MEVETTPHQGGPDVLVAPQSYHWAPHHMSHSRQDTQEAGCEEVGISDGCEILAMQVMVDGRMVDI